MTTILTLLTAWLARLSLRFCGNDGFTGFSVPAAAAIPVGTIFPFAGAALPAGWLECNGDTVSRHSYKALFDVIGTTWGVGNGTTTFGLPDLRGRAPIGAGAGAGLTTRTLGDMSIGAEDVTLSEAQMPNHVHSIYQGNGAGASNGIDIFTTSQNTFATLLVPTTAAKGSSSSHTNMPPSAVVKYMIKV